MRGGGRLALVPCGSLGDRRPTLAIKAKQQLGQVDRSARFSFNSAIEADLGEVLELPAVSVASGQLPGQQQIPIDQRIASA